MDFQGYAFFVRHPRTIADLMQPHLLKQERPYQIVKPVILGKLDYENFTTDMLADRQFIEAAASLCSRSEMWRCLLIRQRSQSNGVLVLPENGCHVGWAAYYAG